MHQVEDIAESLLGATYSEKLVRSVLGSCKVIHYEHEDPNDPCSPRHYFSVRSLGLQIVADKAMRIRTLFFMIVGDEDVDSFPWRCRNGITSSSTQVDIRRILGTPSKSSEAIMTGLLASQGAWDAFDTTPFGRLHFQYAPNSSRLTKITVMTQEAIP